VSQLPREQIFYALSIEQSQAGGLDLGWFQRVEPLANL
jgi:hypothetical protein